jgi:glycosyltransferase involved in cell wall biosynthesis
MKNKVAIIAPPFISIPPSGQGGTERIIDETIKGLIERKYDVTLFGAGKYNGKAKFIKVIDKTISDIKIDPEKIEASRLLRLETAYLSLVMQEIIKNEKKFDIILNHARGGYLFLSLTNFIKIPIVSVMHLPIFKEIERIASFYKNPNIVTISNAQRKNFNKINYLATIYNGIDLSEFGFNKKPKDYFLFVGAMGEHKNPKDAILAIKKSEENLVLAGGKKREPYFSKEIKPLIDNKKIKYVGEVFGKKRIDLFKNAKALLFPIKWEEPFGLVMIEAMACGTPVIAYPKGATKEVIKNNETGFIVKNVSEMVTAIKKIDEISRLKCRQRVEEKFSSKKMIDSYELIINKLTKK